ncbi:MAG: tripartite tricarboxylate transporter TctB family protein [Rhodospirillales bacterium]
MIIRAPRDFWAGLIYLALGIAVVWIGSGYVQGTSARMGPGYFPSVLGSLLALFGAISIVRSFLRSGDAISAIAWKPLVLVLGSTVLFGLLLERAGLLIALPALIVVSALASGHTRFDLTSIGALLGIVAFCVLVFVKGLGVPMPLLGNWLGG